MTVSRGRILIVDDDPDIAAGLSLFLRDAGWEVDTAGDGRQGLKKLDESSPDIVLLDVMLPDSSGLEILEQIRAASESTAVVMMSGAGSIDIAVRAMKNGAETFIAKPFEPVALEAILEQSARLGETRRELAALRRNTETKQTGFAGVSAAARQIDALIGQVASSPTPVLLTGESGTGKGVIARAIHQRSDRARAPFVDLNCAGFSRELLESELFGHEKGAFTDARTAKPGLLEIASRGTVFLDEIGEMELPLQARLLKALEDKRFRRLGGVRELQSDFRLVAATNRDLESEVREGRFRKDLYYRLNVVRIPIPPLRERLEDVPVLAHQILRELESEVGDREPATISERALARLQKYPWPGNVRELRNVLERALLVRKGREIRVEDLLLSADASMASASTAFAPSNEWEIRSLEEVAEDYVRSALAATGGNVRAAARRLGIAPSTLYAKLRSKQ